MSVVLYVSETMKHQPRKEKGYVWITESSISRYLNSDKTPRMDVVVNIAKALQVETDYFLKEEDKGQTAYNVISAAIARKGGELTPEEKNRLIALLIGGNENV